MPTRKLSVAALFAGIGGIELGLRAAGHETYLFCERDAGAQRVLRAHFPDVPLSDDVGDLVELPAVDVVTAGFPCQDLSQAGRTAGISGRQSGLVENVFRLIDDSPEPPTWLLLENVSFMLSLDRGRAMDWLTTRLEERGFTWAYRVVDTKAFGLPQRRQRVLLLASREEDPRPVLLNEEHGEVEAELAPGIACGFYWTEGLRGLGWAVDAVPTLKGGSTIGIPSPPAIWRAGSESLVTPNLRDAERLQGFSADWTKPADTVDGRRRSDRWKLVGNAVSTPVAQWIGERLSTDEDYNRSDAQLSGSRWPGAAWGRAGTRRSVEVSKWPVAYPRPHLHEFLTFPSQPLSARATAGFLTRAARGRLRFPSGLIWAAEQHLKTMQSDQLQLVA